MTINEAITRGNELANNIIPVETKIKWLSDLDGQLATEDEAEEVPKYDYTTDTSTELYVTHPWEGLYVFYIEAMIHYYNHDYEEYNQAVAQYAELLGQYRLHKGKTNGQTSVYYNYFC